MRPGRQIAHTIAAAAAAAATALALGCGGSLTMDDAGATGQGGAGGAIHIGVGGVGGGVLGPAIDGGAPDLSGPAMVCGIRGIPRAAGSCTYALPYPMVGDIRITVFVNGVAIPKDPTGTEGWNYADASNATIQLYGQACTDLISDDRATLDVHYACPIP